MKQYIRFKDIPADEQSGVYDGDLGCVAHEDGVSCYDCVKYGKMFKIVVPSLCTGVLYDLSSFIYRVEKKEIPCYIVEGRQIGIGHHGEPIIKDVKIIHKLKVMELAKPPTVKMDPTNIQLMIK